MRAASSTAVSPPVLRSAAATGSLKVTGPVHPSALYFREGRILFGSSNDPRNQLRAILVESGRTSKKRWTR